MPRPTLKTTFKPNYLESFLMSINLRRRIFMRCSLIRFNSTNTTSITASDDAILDHSVYVEKGKSEDCITN